MSLLATTGAVQRLAPSRAQVRKQARRGLLVAMIYLAVMPPVVALAAHCAAKLVDGRWEIGAKPAQVEGGGR